MSIRDSPPDLAIPELPDLDDGICLLEIGEGHGIAPLQTLVVDRVLVDGGPAIWVDAGRHAVTSSLRQLAPSDRALDRISVARGFTPYQHTSILRTVQDDLASLDPSLFVLPAVDAQYRSDDVRGEAGGGMLLAALAEVARIGRLTETPILLTRETADEFSEPVSALAANEIEYTETRFGPRFASDGWETLVYELDGGWVQTTIAYWNEVLAEREPLYAASAASGAAGGLTIGAD